MRGNQIKKYRRILSWWIIFAFILMPLTNAVEAKTYNYTGLTILHADSKEVASATSINWGVGGNQTHSMSIISGKDYITINSFNTQLNSVLSGLDRRHWGSMGDHNFPVVNSSYAAKYTYKDSDVLMYFKIDDDVSPAVSLVMQGRKASFPGYSFQNLTSNKLYTIGYHPFMQGSGCWGPATYSPGYIGYGPIQGSTDGGNFEQPSAHNFEIYTEAASPVLSASDIKDTRMTLNWNPNGNDVGTNYTLQRRVKGGPPWTEANNIYTGTGNTFTDTNLIPETEYQYRVRVNHIAGTEMNIYSLQGGQEHIDITTSADPAVAYAQEASSKAQAAKEAAEQTLQYSSDAKAAAVNAESKANITLQEVQDSTYGLSALRNEILNIKNTINTAPIIYSLKGVNNATATKTSQITLDASVSNATHYRVNNGSWQLYTKQIIVNGLTVGVNRIEIEFGNLNAELQGETVSTALTVFRLP